IHRLGLVALAEGNSEQAAALFKEGMTSGKQSGDGLIIICLEGLATAEGMQGLANYRASGVDLHAERAVRLFGVAAAQRQRYAAPPPPFKQQPQQEQLAALRTLLGEAAFTAAWESGQALTWEQAVVEALVN